MENWNDIKKELLEDKEIYKEYMRLGPRYELISQLISARNELGMTQSALAKKIGTKQSAIARIESGNANPSFDFLVKLSNALGKKIVIGLK